MVIEIHYFSPTTPGAASFDVDVSSEARRGRIGPFSGEAQMAAVGSGNQVLDDIDSTLGHAADGILGLKQWYVDETACPSGNQRVYTGYTFNRNYARGDSLVQGAARKVDVTLMDPNSFLDFRVFAPVDVDPTSSFVRPAEDTYERIQALLAVDFLSTTLFDLGYIPSTGALPLDAHDYTGSKPSDVVRDIAQVLGWNPWVGYDETANKLFLWFDDWTTDGTATVPYDSTLKLTNVESEENGTDTFLIELNAVETVDPSRVISAVYVMGKGTNVYVTRPTTANTFGWRDAVYEATFLSDAAKLEALGERYLLDNSTEDHKISCTVQLPAQYVTAIHEGMRIQIHGTHLPSAAAGFTWTRILHRTVRVDIETQEFYWLDLELSPIPELCAPPDAHEFHGVQTFDGFLFEIANVQPTPVDSGSLNEQGTHGSPLSSYPAPSLTPGSGVTALLMAGYIIDSELSSTPGWGPYGVGDLDAIDFVNNTGTSPQYAIGHLAITGASGSYAPEVTNNPRPNDYEGFASSAAVWVASGGTPTIVQSVHASSSGDYLTITLPAPATLGSVLVIFLTERNRSSPFIQPTMTPITAGWTGLAEVKTPPASGPTSRQLRMMWYVCE